MLSIYKKKILACLLILIMTVSSISYASAMELTPNGTLPFQINCTIQINKDILTELVINDEISKDNDIEIIISEQGNKTPIFKQITKKRKVQISGLIADVEYDFDLRVLDNKKGYTVESYASKFKIVTKESLKGKQSIDKASAKILNVTNNLNQDVNNLMSATVNEVESNDSFSLADRIYDNDDVYGYIGNSSDIDYYKIQFNEAGKANFWMDVPDGKDYDMYVYDDAYNEIQKSIKGAGIDELISELPVAASRYYYVKIIGYGGAYSTTESYHMRAKNYPPGDQYEPNNAFYESKSLSSSGETIYATIHNVSDEDYFSVYLSSESNVVITLDNIPTNCDYDLKLYDSSQVEIDSSLSGGNSSENITQTLQAGTYYIKIYSYTGYSDIINYTLQANISATLSQKRQEILQKAKDMIDVQWVPTSNLKGWKNNYTFTAGNTYSGIPYSQTEYQVDDTGFYASLNYSTFYSAYSPSYSTYYMPKYGNDCSGFTSFAWGVSRHTTYTFNQGIETGEFSKVGSYNVTSPTRTDLLNSYDLLSPGDAVVARSDHQHVFVIKERQEGTDNFICYEQTPYWCRVTTWTKSDLADHVYKPFTLNELANQSLYFNISNIGELQSISLMDNNIKDNKLSLYKRKYSKEAKDEYYLNLYSVYENNKKIEISEDNDVEWISSNKEVAIVSKGKIETVGQGECTITAKYQGKEVAVNINVFDADPVKIKMPNNIVINKKGESKFIDINATLSNGEIININNVAKWEAVDSNVAIAFDGRILAEGKGETVIKISFGDLSQNIKVTVLSDN